MRVCATVWMSNHAHILLCPEDIDQLAAYMGFVNGNVAKEVNLLHGWGDRIWARRYNLGVISDETEAQVNRLRYILTNGCKEGLVARPSQWPGVQCVEALLTGRPLHGLWYDRSEEGEDQRRGRSPSKYQYANEEVLNLEPLPCWSTLPPQGVRQQVAAMVREIEQETADQHDRKGTQPMGVKKILRQDPHDIPATTKRSPAPRFHAYRPEVWKAMNWAFLDFLDAYRRAANKLKAGHRNVEFPPGCFPPRLPFVKSRSAFAFP